ncbi:MAG: hypothetical protein WCK41_09190 [Actinomycetes bacterium]
MRHLITIAGIGFNPGIRGILVVLTGFVVLCGSTYLLLATNTGARLGMLIAFAGLFGWLTILTLTWWISPPAIGPRGTNASWKPVEIYVDSGGQPQTAAIQALIDAHPGAFPSAAQIIADHPELQKDFANPAGASLSDIQSSHPEIISQYISKTGADGTLNLNGWHLTAASAAGEAQAAADAALTTTSKFFEATSDYKKLSVYEFGGKPTRAEYCPGETHPGNLIPDDVFCRIQYKIDKLVNYKHPPHYAVVQVQQVVPQTAKPGEAPPIPVADASKPVVWVVLVRDLGNVRLLPGTYFVICFSLFIVFVLLLHYRDKTLKKNIEAAESVDA